MSFLPKISIITICYNAEVLLPITIESVVQQSYPNIEYIIVDGNSKDKTLDVLKRYEKSIKKWISEPDKGIYDAMNKGLQLATGDYVWFMNAGDAIFEKDTLTKAVQQISPETDVFYGETMLVDEQRMAIGTRSDNTTQKLPEKLNWKSLRYGMVVCHQAILVKRSIVPDYQDITNLSADIDWVIQSLKNARKIDHTHLILANYLMGGVSKKRHQQSLWGRYAILKKHYGFIPNLWNHFIIVLRSVFYQFFKQNEVKY